MPGSGACARRALGASRHVLSPRAEWWNAFSHWLLYLPTDEPWHSSTSSLSSGVAPPMSMSDLSRHVWPVRMT